jgi:hypothetical protein
MRASGIGATRLVSRKHARAPSGRSYAFSAPRCLHLEFHLVIAACGGQADGEAVLCTREQASVLIAGTGWEFDRGSEWEIDRALGDPDGWLYALNFGWGEWHSSCGMTDCVRRRGWLRRLRKSDTVTADGHVACSHAQSRCPQADSEL